MSTTTYAVTMAELKPESGHNGVWYGSPVQMSTTGRTNHHSVADTSASGRSRTENTVGWSSMDHHQSAQQQYPPPYGGARYGQDDNDPYDAARQQSHTSLGTHHSYSNLKRSYSATEQPPYQEMVQDLRGDESKMGVGHDHKLLSFRKVQDKHAIVDQHGRMQQLELTAQLHGMFFLSELPTNSGEGGMITQPELTCYRRNLFQISGSLVTPRGQLSVVLETGETVPVTNTEVTISSVESVDGHSVRLIVIPWKTPPPNSPEIPQGPDQEPPALPLIPFQDDGSEAEGEFAVYPVGWRRLQFRIATANNGRRKELQQHFTLHLKVMGTLSNGTKVVLTEATTAPVVVRGRSPRNFQARKEIPLLGSSAGSRGQALVETGLGIVAGPLNAKPQVEMKSRSMNMDVPRAAFNFNAPPKMPPSPLGGMRSNSYPTTWNPPMSHMAPTNPGYSSSSIPGDAYPKLALPGAQGYTAEPTEMAAMPSMQLAMNSSDPHAHHAASRQPYPAYQQQQQQQQQNTPSSMNIPRYVDDARPTKSARHGSMHHQATDSGDYRYGAASAGYVTPAPSGAGTSGMSPSQSQQHPSPYASATSTAVHHHQQQQQQHQGHGGAAPPTDGQTAPQGGSSSSSGGGVPTAGAREYYPTPGNSWASSQGDAAAAAVAAAASANYANGSGASSDQRHAAAHATYSYPAPGGGGSSSSSGAGVPSAAGPGGVLAAAGKDGQQGPPPPQPVYPGSMGNYSWSAA